jgi:hypothetical protein
MPQTIVDKPYRLGFFDSVSEADQAVRRLQAAGFSQKELAVICPKKFHEQFTVNVRRAERPGSHVAEGIAEGGAAGAVLGGIALAATAIATGGVGLLPAIGVLIGGGALAGGFSGLILSDGYGKEVGEYYEEAIRLGKIVVGVHVEGEDRIARLGEAERILTESGGQLVTPTKDD